MTAEAGGPPSPVDPPLLRSFDFDAIRAIVEKEFRIYEVERDIRGLPNADIAAFYVMSEKETFDKKFENVRDAIRMLDERLIVVLQHRMGEDVILVARRPPVNYGRGRLNVFLLVATIVTTTLAGSLFWVGYKKLEDLWTGFGTDLSFFHWEPLLWGFLTFGFPLMLILGIHELGHWFVARRHRVRTSLPYFIPVPPPLLFGTFGAFISMKEPIPDRKALFDIGAAGPIAGFLVTLPVLVIGMVLTAMVAEQLPPQPEVHTGLESPDGTAWGFDANETAWTAQWQEDADGNVWVESISVQAGQDGFLPGPGWRLVVRPVFLEEDAVWMYNITTTGTAAQGALANRTIHGDVNVTLAMVGGQRVIEFAVPDGAASVTVTTTWRPPASGLVSLGDSLAFAGLSWIVDLFIDRPDDVFIHPTALAGWVGLLVTGFNLLPAGQLDGGHVARAVFGDGMRWASYASIGLMFALSFLFPGWLILAVLVLLLGVRHPPPLNDRTELDRHRIVLAAVVGIVLVLSFVPIPLQAIP